MEGRWRHNARKKKRDNTDKIKSLKIDEIYEICKDWWSYLSALERQPTDRWPRWTLEFGLTLALAKSCSQAHHGFQTVNGFSDDFPKMSCLSLCWRKLSFIIKSLLAAMQSTISVINNCLALSSPLPLFFCSHDVLYLLSTSQKVHLAQTSCNCWFCQ